MSHGVGLGRGPDDVAVWTGRFQPAHEGHFAILKHSIMVLQLPHAAILTSYSGWESRTGEYGVMARVAYDSARNPLTEWERVRLMLLGLEQHQLDDDVTVMVAPRHDLDWEHVSRFYPRRRLICLTDKDDFEQAKADLWTQRGERIYVFRNFRNELTLTTTKIRALVRSGADWRSFMPEASHAFFAEIGGPERVFGVSQ